MVALSLLSVRDQLHDIIDFLLHAMNFPTCHTELSVSAGNLSVSFDKGYLCHVDMDQTTVRFGQFNPRRSSTLSSGDLLHDLLDTLFHTVNFP
jgi:hypothetical protein